MHTSRPCRGVHQLAPSPVQEVRVSHRKCGGTQRAGYSRGDRVGRSLLHCRETVILSTGVIVSHETIPPRPMPNNMMPRKPASRKKNGEHLECNQWANHGAGNARKVRKISAEFERQNKPAHDPDTISVAAPVNSPKILINAPAITMPTREKMTIKIKPVFSDLCFICCRSLLPDVSASTVVWKRCRLSPSPAPDHRECGPNELAPERVAQDVPR